MDRNAAIFSGAVLISGLLLLTSSLGFAAGLAVSIGVFSVVWVVSLILRNASIVDIFWGPGFVGVGSYYAFAGPSSPTTRGLVVFALVTVWAVRLALHIGFRNAGAGEDFRYRKWRDEAGRNFWWVSFFKVFLLQGVVLWIVSSPLLLAQLDRGKGLTAADGLGLALWAFGFAFEAVADFQLQSFKRNPANRGRVMQSGLWSMSRHPNYFGEAVLWWGIGLLTLPTGGWLSFIGPLMITFMLLKVSGVSLLDTALVERRPGYAAYIASTPAFLPLPRRLRRKS